MKSRILLFFFALLPVFASAGELKDGLLFYWDFSDLTKARFTSGAPPAALAGKWVEAPIGKGVEPEGGVLRAPVVKNLAPLIGSASFWVRPGKNIRDLEADADLFRGSDHIRLRFSATQRVLHFMTGTTKEGAGFKWQYAAVKEAWNWDAEVWHHVALTWDCPAGRKQLYLDGKLVSETQTEWMNPKYTGNKAMALGAAGFPAAYAQWLCWDRVLTAPEVALLCAAGGKIEAQLGQVSATPARTLPALRVEAGVFSENPAATVVKSGEQIFLPILLSNRSAERMESRLVFRLVDFWNREMAQQTLDVGLAPGERKLQSIPWKAPRTGVYKMVVALPGPGTNGNRDAGSFAVLDRPASTSNRDSFFGHHVNSWYDGRYIEQAAKLGQGWMRGHNMLQITWWNQVQPEPGPFQFAKASKNLDYLDAHGMPILGQLFGTPTWAASIPQPRGKGYTGVPPQWDAFARYVRETVTRYKGRISHWEIGNEPEVSVFWRGTPEEFAEYCRIAYREAKAADPHCVVMSAGNTTPPWIWHEQAAKAGAWKWCDLMSIHLTYSARKSTEANEREFASVLGHFRELAIKYGATGKPLPIWNSETGITDSPWLSDLDPETAPIEEALPDQVDAVRGAIRMVQGEILMQAMGIDKHFLYFQTPVKPSVLEDYVTLEFTGAPRPKTLTRAVLDAFLEKAVPEGPYVKRSEAGFWAFTWRAPSGGSLAALWCEDGNRVSFEAPKGMSAQLDLFGGPKPMSTRLEVGDEPVFLRVSQDATTLLSHFRQVRLESISRKAPETELAADRPEIPVLPDFLAAGEAGPAKTFFLDLSPFANFGFADEVGGDGKGGWTDEGPLNDLRGMPIGFLRFYNVPFRVLDPAKNGGKSILTLKGQSTTPGQPEAVSNIPVGGKVRSLFFLQAAGWGTPGTIGHYRFHYEDGTTATAPLTIPGNTHNWWNGWAKQESSKPVAIRVTNTASGKPAWRYLRVWEWQNPKQEQPLRSIDFVSASGRQTPILVAVTGVRW
jgi:hypothetical protein